MKLIQDVFWITGRGCTILVDDEDYLINDNISIYNSDTLINTVQIRGIEFHKNIDDSRKNPIALNINKISKEDINLNKIASGMQIIKINKKEI